MQNWKKHKKRKKTLFVNTPVLTVLVKMSVLFLHFWFLLFLEFPCFSEMFLIGFQNSKNHKIWKQQKNTNNKKTRCKAKTNPRLWFKKARQQAENKKKTKTEEQLERKKQTKQKEETTTRYRNEKQKGRNQEKNKRDTKKEKVKKEETPKRLKINKGKHRIINNKNALF